MGSEHAEVAERQQDVLGRQDALTDFKADLVGD
jgi:hypothetical protein